MRTDIGLPQAVVKRWKGAASATARMSATIASCAGRSSQAFQISAPLSTSGAGRAAVASVMRVPMLRPTPAPPSARRKGARP